MNLPLFSAILSIASTVIIGVLMIVLIVLDYISGVSMVAAAGVGLLISVPIAMAVTKKVGSLGKSQ